ncbi:MAG: GTP-binding protein [Proteobacteria bacterium]|nr:GTP-binding protein [Pseudomonadota bacterium]
MSLKIVTLGAAAVGKTSLLWKMEGQQGVPSQTIGTEFVKIKEFEIWDTSAIERYRSMPQSYYKDAVIILLCFNPADLESFQYLEKTLEKEKAAIPLDIKYVLVETKSDLEATRQVTAEALAAFKEKYNIKHPDIKTNSGEKSDPKTNELLQIFRDLITPKTEESPEPVTVAEKKEEPLKTNPSNKQNAPFMLDVFISLAAVAGGALIVAAILLASPPMLIAGIALSVLVGGSLFYRANKYPIDCSEGLPSDSPSLLEGNFY